MYSKCGGLPVTLYMNCSAQRLAYYSTSSASSWAVMLLWINVQAGRQKHSPQQHWVEPPLQASHEVGEGRTCRLQLGLRFPVRQARCGNKKTKGSLNKCQAFCSQTDSITLFFMKIDPHPSQKWLRRGYQLVRANVPVSLRKSRTILGSVLFQEGNFLGTKWPKRQSCLYPSFLKTQERA